LSAHKVSEKPTRGFEPIKERVLLFPSIIVVVAGAVARAVAAKLGALMQVAAKVKAAAPSPVGNDSSGQGCHEPKSC
jgi:hypothetical protein